MKHVHVSRNSGASSSHSDLEMGVAIGATIALVEHCPDMTSEGIKPIDKRKP